jgi:hypothetical protein
VLGEAGSRVTVVSLPARGRPPQAAARRAGLEFVEKLLTSAMVALLDDAEREHASPAPPSSHWSSWLPAGVLVLVVVVVAHRGTVQLP